MNPPYKSCYNNSGYSIFFQERVPLPVTTLLTLRLEKTDLTSSISAWSNKIKRYIRTPRITINTINNIISRIRMPPAFYVFMSYNNNDLNYISKLFLLKVKQIDKVFNLPALNPCARLSSNHRH
jgi:hypothetical protein